MSHEEKRVYRVLIGTTMALALGIATVPAKGDRLVVTKGNDQNVPVMEEQGGTLTWIIQNQGPGAITLDNSLRKTGVRFVRSGGDNDDKPKVGTISGCDSGVKLPGGGGQCVLVVDFTTPDIPDTTPDENSDRGFWNLESSRGTSDFPMLEGALANGMTVTSGSLLGHVEVDDPGKSAVTPEPPTIMLTLTSIVFGLSAWARKQYGRDSKARQKACDPQ
jgi:hypothetical protein